MFSSQGEEQAIMDVLKSQEDSWNAGDIEGYMQGYWQSEQLTFIGKSGVKYGWKNTLDNYKKSYPNKEAMGKLHTEIQELYPLSDDYWYAIGTWQLQRNIGNLQGHFTLLFRQIEGEWVIVSDHSS